MPLPVHSCWLAVGFAQLGCRCVCGAAGGCGSTRDRWVSLRCGHIPKTRLLREPKRRHWQRRRTVTATQAPDATVMAESQRKIIECATGDFGAQATLQRGLVEAYQAAKAKVEVTNLRAAVERHNSRRLDGHSGRDPDQADQHRGPTAGTGLPVARQDGTRQRFLQDREAGPGEQVTVVLDGTDPAELAVDGPGPRRRQGWLPRAGAFAFDVIIPLSVAAVPLVLIPAARKPAWLFWLCIGVAVGVLFAMAVNQLVLPAITGWSGAVVVRHRCRHSHRRTGEPWLLILRDMAHVFGHRVTVRGLALAAVGFARQNVRRPSSPNRGPAGHRRGAAESTPAGPVACGGAAIAVVVGGLGFQEVYRTQKAVEQSGPSFPSRGRRSSSKCSATRSRPSDDFARHSPWPLTITARSSSRSSRRWRKPVRRQ